MNIMTNLAQLMAETALTAQEDAKEKARQEAERRKAAEEQWYQDGIKAANTDFPKILEEIKEHSLKGRRNHYISIQSMASSYSLNPMDRGYKVRMVELLTENGFKFSETSSSEEPSGSDPISWHTLYYHGLEVSW
jgi:DNA-binding protein H-NS